MKAKRLTVLSILTNVCMLLFTVHWAFNRCSTLIVCNPLAVSKETEFCKQWKQGSLETYTSVSEAELLCWLSDVQDGHITKSFPNGATDKVFFPFPTVSFHKTFRLLTALRNKIFYQIWLKLMSKFKRHNEELTDGHIPVLSKHTCSV